MLPAKVPRTDIVVRQALDEIQKAGLAITPVNLVAAARVETHPLHSYFEWDDSKAAEKYRQLQAYKLIAAQHTLRLVTEGEERQVHADGAKALRSYLPLRNGSDEYAQRQSILDNPDARARNVKALIAELRAWVRRSADLEEVQHLRVVIEENLPPIEK